MMMKIFGAALIVSGGFLMGKLHASREVLRLNSLKNVYLLADGFAHKLSEQRLSLDLYLEGKDAPASAILSNSSIKGLTEEDQNQINDWVTRLRSGSFRESISSTKIFLEELKQKIEDAEKSAASSGKALPMVTAAIALIAAVLLY